MTSVQLEQAVRRLVGELAMVRAQNTLLAVFLDRLEGFSREQFEREFAAFWETQGGALAQAYWEELEKGSIQARKHRSVHCFQGHVNTGTYQRRRCCLSQPWGSYGGILCLERRFRAIVTNFLPSVGRRYPRIRRTSASDSVASATTASAGVYPTRNCSARLTGTRG
jgi:hypothetical protein